jgi:hypothetical protein
VVSQTAFIDNGDNPTTRLECFSSQETDRDSWRDIQVQIPKNELARFDQAMHNISLESFPTLVNTNERMASKFDKWVGANVIQGK